MVLSRKDKIFPVITEKTAVPVFGSTFHLRKSHNRTCPIMALDLRKFLRKLPCAEMWGNGIWGTNVLIKTLLTNP